LYLYLNIFLDFAGFHTFSPGLNSS